MNAPTNQYGVGIELNDSPDHHDCGLLLIGAVFVFSVTAIGFYRLSPSRPCGLNASTMTMIRKVSTTA